MLGQIVNDVVLDLEDILRGYEEAATTIGQMSDVLRSLNDLGMPARQIEAIERMLTRPETLPRIAAETQALINSALDDIYIDADQRDAGQSVDLASTIEALERWQNVLGYYQAKKVGSKDLFGASKDQVCCLLKPVD